MEKIISVPISAIYYLCFGFFLVLFHPIQWLSLKLGGYRWHKKSVDYLNLCLLSCTRLVGTTYKIENIELIPKGVPIIMVANHQSMYDIIAIIWYFRKFHPKFVSKKELGKGIPSVSFNLRHGGSVLIDRKDPKQSIPTIKKLGAYVQKYTRSAVIFPEGTRSRDGNPKPFSQTGFKILCKAAPSALVVPITINNSWKMVKFGIFPVGLGNRLIFTVHKPMPVNSESFDQLADDVEKIIISKIKI